MKEKQPHLIIQFTLTHLIIKQVLVFDQLLKVNLEKQWVRAFTSPCRLQCRKCCVVFSVLSISPPLDVIRQHLAELPYEKMGHARWQLLMNSIPSSDSILFFFVLIRKQSPKKQERAEKACCVLPGTKYDENNSTVAAMQPATVVSQVYSQNAYTTQFTGTHIHTCF